MFENIVHIGAHLCEEKDDYQTLSDKQIIWVEADPQLFLRASQEIAPRQYVRHKLLNYFVTNLQQSEISLNIFNNDGASNSIHKPTNKIKKYWPKLEVIETRNVRTCTLAKIIEETQIVGNNNLLVLDVQGHELNVLKSGKDKLYHFSNIVCELSYVSLYRGSPNARRIEKFLRNEGFILENPRQDFHYDGKFRRIKF